MPRITDIPRSVRALLFAAFLLPVTIGCENSFAPLEDNDRYNYSIYGTLDLYADTQWVRVMPVIETLIPDDSTDPGVEVTLTRASTGDTSLLNDSLFVFGAGAAYVRNYWTTMPLFPNEEYILQAEGPDGRTSSSRVTVPSSLPLPLVEYSQEDETGQVTGTSDDPLVVVETIYYVQEITEVGLGPEEMVRFSQLEKLIFNRARDEYRLQVNDRLALARELNLGEDEFVVNRRELLIVTGSEDWPDLSDLTELEIVLPEVVSNVENGTGVVAGIASRRVPLKSCFDGSGAHIPCEDL